LSFAQGTGKVPQGMIGFGFTSHLINKHEIFSLPLSPAVKNYFCLFFGLKITFDSHLKAALL